MKIFSVLLISILFLIPGCSPDKEDNNRTKANFSITGYEVPVPATLLFVNISTNATSYFWDFGDGTTSTEQYPSHVYTLAGTYQLKLKATGPSGSDSICKLVSLDPPVVANKSSFNYFFDKCTGYPVGAAFKSLNPASSNTVWDFGNGVVNISRDPIVQFILPGDYTIKYSSQINNVRDTVVRIIRIE